MNENIDLTKILKDCPKGWKFWSSMFGDVSFHSIIHEEERVYVISKTDEKWYINADATITLYSITSKEIMLFPSKDQRDWSKFTAPWLQKKKFDPKILQPFDKVLVRDEYKESWCCDFFSHISRVPQTDYKCATTKSYYRCCVPYNDETKYLVGTKDEAPEFYRYWED